MEQAGVLLSLDRGDGVLSRLMSSEIGEQISISGSLDGYGVRTLSFSREGFGQSPLLTSVLRSKREVLATGFLGSPGGVTGKSLFLGTLRSAPFDSLPAVAQIECQDGSAQWLNIPFVYSLQPGQRTSRMEVIVDIVQTFDIPCDVESLDFGADDGGVITKGITAAGETTLGAFIADFAKPMGRRPRVLPDGTLAFIRIDETATPKKTLTAGDLLSLKIAPPAVNDSNSVTATAKCFAYVGPSGTRITVEIEDGPTETFTPPYAAAVQVHASGAVNAMGAGGAVTGPRWRKITQTRWNGGTIIEQLVEEYGYYSPKVCRNKQDAAGAVSWNPDFDVYFYPDGTDRLESQYQWRVVRRWYLAKSVPSGGAIGQGEYETHYQAIEMPIKSVDAAGVEHFIAGLQTSDGRSWWAGQETIDLDTTTVFTAGVIGMNAAFSLHDVETYATGYEARTREQGTVVRIDRTFNANADKQVATDTVAIFLYAQYTYNYQGTTAPAPPTLSWKFPFVASRPLLIAPAIYATQSNAGAFGWVRLDQASSSITRTQFDESTFTASVAFNIPAQFKIELFFFVFYDESYFNTYEDFSHFFIGKATYLPLPIPVLEYLTDETIPAAHSQTSPDDVRIALAGETFPTYIQADMCETDDELLTVAWEELRLRSADRIPIEIPFDPDLEEGDVVAVRQPTPSGGVLEFNGVIWDWSVVAGGRGDVRNAFTLLRFPPNLRQVA